MPCVLGQFCLTMKRLAPTLIFFVLIGAVVMAQSRRRGWGGYGEGGYASNGVRTAREAYQSVMDDVGANIPRHDSADLRVLNDVRQRQFTVRGSRGKLPGIIDTQADVGGWPELKNGPAPEDSDKDGMPDWYETRQDLDPNDPADGNALGANGYTHLEHYLHWIVENGSIDPKPQAPAKN